jgi:hypothetical protein
MAGAFQVALRGVKSAKSINEEYRMNHPDHHVNEVNLHELIVPFFARWSNHPNEKRIMALLDRGFTTDNQFLEEARPFYLYEKLGTSLTIASLS